MLLDEDDSLRLPDVLCACPPASHGWCPSCHQTSLGGSCSYSRLFGLLFGNSPPIQSYSEPSTYINIKMSTKVRQHPTPTQHNPSTNVETALDSSLLENNLEYIPF